MSSKSYEFTARGKLDAPRPQLMSAWTLVGFAVVVLVLLAMTFQKQEFLQQAAREKLGDTLSINYLTNLLKADSNNFELRVLLAEHKIYLGELTTVPALLEPVLQSDDVEWKLKARLAQYKYLAKQAALSEKGSKQAAELNRQRHVILADLVKNPWPAETLVYLADQAAKLQEFMLAEKLRHSIKEVAWQMSPEWFAEAAEQVLSQGGYELAAHLYFMARQNTRTEQKQRKYLMAGIAVLMSNGMFNEAMRAADQYLGNLENDPETLYLLAKAARAAKDMVRADRYARMMLRLSWLDRASDWLQRLELSPIATANAAADEVAIKTPDGMLPYDERSYQLAYDIFLGNRNVADAYRVAEAAVHQVPAEVVWHKRLAQVAEWNNKPEIALREWRWLMMNGGSETALMNVLRLAPLLGDVDTLLEVWKRLAAERKMDEAQWNSLADLFEQTGKQREGIKYFEARFQSNPSPLLLAIEARLASRSGNDELAKTLYLRQLKQYGFNAEPMLKVTMLYLQKGQYQKAYDFLQEYRAQAETKEVAYWKLLADLSWQLQHDSEAMKDYRILAAEGKLAREDFDRLIYLLGDTQQEEVAALAELVYRKFGDRDMLLRALSIHAARHDLVAQKRLFDGIEAEHATSFANSYRFYLLRAQYLQASGDSRAARTDLRRAAALAPSDANIATAMLWFLIDAHDQVALREMLAQIIERGDQLNPAYWGALAAAYQTLDQPSQAVAYYSRQLKQNGQDFLWLVNYADALEQNGQAGMALRVRQHAWLQLRGKLHDKELSLPFTPDMLAAARLVLLNHPGDADLALVGSVLRQDRLLKQDAATDNQTSELILGWAASKEQSSNAKAWLWQRYGLTLKRPLWGEAMVAVAENDTERLDHLLSEQADGMSMLVRHDAAKALEQIRYAQSIVFEGMAANPNSEEIHQRLTEDALSTASFVNIEMRNEQLGTYHGSVRSTQIEVPVANNLRLAGELRQTHQTNDAGSVMGSIPPNERIGGLALKIHGSAGDTEIGFRRRNEFASTTESHVKHDMNILSGVHLQLGAELHAEATESNDLRIFGMRNQVDASLLYALSKREYLHIQPGYARYYTQTGNSLGSGEHLSWEIGHRIRVEYPDWTLRLTGSHIRFNGDATTVLALPNNANLYGLCFGFGQANRDDYTRAWRPYLDYCVTNNDVSGQGYNTGFGVAGSLAGHDHLALSFRQEVGGTNMVNGTSRELTLNYRYFFDRY